MLVECGFLTNPTEAQYAQSSDYRQKLAQEIARGILNRPALATRTAYTNRSSRVDVGLQPFLDQRFVRESGAKHRRHKTSTKKNPPALRKESKLRGTVNSPVVTSAQMRDAENAAFARGVSAEA